MQPAGVVSIALGTGLLLGVGAGVWLRGAFLPQPKVEIAAPPADEGDDDEALLAANASLVSSLQECNRRLTDLGQKRVTAPAAVPTVTASGRTRGAPPLRRATTSEDWERYAKQGIVPYQLPCIRDTPFTPTPRQLDRLGLAPEDATVLREAYQKSNQRVLAQLKPLCAGVLGNDQLAERVGASACMSAIIDGARKENPEKMREALSRVGEVNAGKRAAPAPGQPTEPVEALLLAFTGEARAFEADLAALLGPDEAHRIASSRTLCSERGVVRAKFDGQQD